MRYADGQVLFRWVVLAEGQHTGCLWYKAPLYLDVNNLDQKRTIE